MRIALFTCSCFLAFTLEGYATEFHVATNGTDANTGTQAAPLRTIQRGADLAQPGDTITVHAGVYRERITPPRGGESDAKRIVYQTAPGEKVVIKGSEVVKGWENVQDDVWKVSLPNSYFGKFNPYADLIRGDWFNPKKRAHHTGAVYLNGDWLVESATLEDVLRKPGVAKSHREGARDDLKWFARVNADETVLWAQFPDIDPNAQRVEINVRQAVFYPDKPGRNYITVCGFILKDAATPWAPPTAEQIGLIGTHWSKGWIIEDNVISHSVCSGIALGKYADEWDNKAGSAEGYVGTINRALKNGWNKETIGHHLVRNNVVSHCEQAGIVGSLGCSFSTVTGNTIHDIHARQLFGGAEMAGIKFHGAIDVEISRNHIYRTHRGLWLDWMAQGTRVSGNLFHENGEDMYLEVNHGPFLVDNNIFLSPKAMAVWSQGGAFVHNLIGGSVSNKYFDGRMTPFNKAHSTEIAGLHNNPSGDVRFYNNLFVNLGDVSAYDSPKLPVWMEGNVYLAGAKPSRQETKPLLLPTSDPAIKLMEEADGFYLEMKLEKARIADPARKLVTTELLGKAAIAGLPFEASDGTPYRINTDYFGQPRNEQNPAPGPFEKPEAGKLKVRELWK